MTTTKQTAGQRITEEVTSWPGVEAGFGSRGEFGFTLGRRALGHLHGDRVFHAGFPKAIWQRLFDEGRIDYHPVFPGKAGYAARKIESDEDVRDVIELIRLNYDRAVARHGLPRQAPDATDAERRMATGIEDLYAATPETLPFARSLDIRAFVVRRDRGNLLLYSTTTLRGDTSAIAALGGISRHYLNHSHEALFAADSIDAPLFVHESGLEAVSSGYRVRATFSKRHTLDDDFEVIPTPGHTPDATAYLWSSGAHRVLFTGDTIYLDDGEWVAAVLAGSDRQAYIQSLELLRDVDFDVLVPWAATRGQPYYAITGHADARRRIGAILQRLQRGEHR
ncbi:MAG TPA: luciferase family protein [Solirubrobacteraceae bacterium]|nr:luciferase family protein [Solirubrobacteraceae bacterium]